ncbi:NPCBM/NEW2 domain-containing protein [Longimicrobium sp.]|jgi:predicted O-methyltransferase YrrM|uniref:NPCBM/NEW2 domain-containing protein n=1 Tax=Longimicrobium sp. TaxID=2029185 RepID=UPI002EDAE264
MTPTATLDTPASALDDFLAPPAPEPPPSTLHLDTLPPASATVGYGELGTGGSLGYEGKTVTVQRTAYSHALSTHPPARVRWELDGEWKTFRCQVALNGDVPTGRSHADFQVYADGRRVAEEYRVSAGAPPRALQADITGARTLELVATTTRWASSHAVWLNPELDRAAPAADVPLLDCLQRVHIHPPAAPIVARRCIATVVSPGFEALLDDLLGSVVANAGCPDARLVVFAVDPDAACRRIAARYGAEVVECTRKAHVNATVKSVMYSTPRVIDAEQFICLDADMLVLDDLDPVFAAIDACAPGAILACREANGFHYDDVEHAVMSVYGGRPGDLARIMGRDGGEGRDRLVVNDGIFAGSRGALQALDSLLREWRGAPRWVDERKDIWWRNQAVFNLAIAHLRCGVELDAVYNVQMNNQEVEMAWEDGRAAARWQGRRARVLHFNGLGRHKCPEWRGLFARAGDPVTGAGGGDGYAAFVAALRGWVGRYGQRALAWSFYGTADGLNGKVRDPGTFPLFGLLHYLVKSNGCARVLETGTARGVSAACLASAVAHRRGAVVVTVDREAFAQRDDLWAALPPAARGCIQPRTGDSLEELDAAIERGERYDAALLDSLHEEEYVYAEFQRAVQLVCPGGLILFHDAFLPGATVDRALLRIEADGYNVTRLWGAECGFAEDDGQGFALVVNRRRAGAGAPQ